MNEQVHQCIHFWLRFHVLGAIVFYHGWRDVESCRNAAKSREIGVLPCIFFFAMVGVMLLTVLFLCSCFDSFADEFGGVHVWKQVNHSL